MLTYQTVVRIPPECSPGYFWQINGKIELDELKEQLRDMYALGLRSVCLHPFPDEFRPVTQPSRVNIPYLSKEWFDMVRELCAECHRLGMVYWLYDEGGWPSGGAGGQVWSRAADRRAIQRHYLELENGVPAVKTVEENPAVAAPYPDILNRKVTREFIALTHEQYRGRVGKYFGKEIRFVFTDEPGSFRCEPGKLAYTPGFEAEFKKVKGYAIEPYLTDLLKPERDDEPESVTLARIDYHEVISRLFVRRFLRPVRSWCRKNGLLAGGHFSEEDDPAANRFGSYGNILQSLRMLDVPGVDAIWRQVFPGGRTHPFPKYASSAANQNGSRYALAEVFAVYGSGLTPEEMRWIIDFMFACGINLIVPSCLAIYNGKNFMSGIRPRFGRINPLWRYMEEFHRYVARGCHLLSLGKPCCRTAVYYDIRSIRAGGTHMTEAIRLHESVAREMQERQCAFDFIDDDMLSSAGLSEKGLKVGRMHYRTIVIPSAFFMTGAAGKKLAAFEQAGGMVLDAASANRADRLITLSPPSGGIRVNKRVSGKQAIYFIFNESAASQSLRLVLPEKGNIIHYDALSGGMRDIASKDGAFDWTFAPWESFFFIIGLNDAKTVHPQHLTESGTTLDSGWTLQPIRSYAPGEEDYEITTLNSSPFPATLGDWRSLVGEAFSGEAVYRISFRYDGRRNCCLELGKVCYACSVKLNGVDCGKKILPPFRFNLGKNLNQGLNSLEITVANTLANAISPDSVKDSWSRNWRLPYESRQRVFEKDHLEGGLFGPVRIVEAVKIP